MLAQGLLLVMADIPTEHEEEFNRWYEEEHLDERITLPGFLSARRFTALEGSPKYLAIYDLESPEALHSPEYRHIVGPGKSERTKRMESLMTYRRNVYVALTERKK